MLNIDKGLSIVSQHELSKYDDIFSVGEKGAGRKGPPPTDALGEFAFYTER
jgi:hypothetical protein